MPTNVKTARGEAITTRTGRGSDDTITTQPLLARGQDTTTRSARGQATTTHTGRGNANGP